MKLEFKALSVATLALGVLTLFSCGPEKTVEVTAVEIISTPSPLVLAVGATGKVEAAVVPSDASDKSVEWSVDPEGVVEVAADGTVTAIGPGHAVITATSANDITGDCAVVVNTVLEDTGVELTVGTDETSGDLKMLQVSFAKGMPVMDITVPGVALAETVDGYSITGDGIVPTTVMGGNTVPVATYTITELVGSASARDLTFVMMCGKFPLSFSGSRDEDSGAFTGQLIVSPAID